MALASKQRNMKYTPKLMGYANNIGDIWYLLKTQGFSPLQCIQTGSCTYAVRYLVGFGFCPGGKEVKK